MKFEKKKRKKNAADGGSIFSQFPYADKSSDLMQYKRKTLTFARKLS